MTNTATFVRKLDGGWHDARLYELSEPIPVGWPPFDDDEPDERPFTNFVIVSAIANAFDHGGPETLSFAADAEGNVLSWADGPGSQRGTTDHERVIRDAGWEIA